MKNLMLTLAFLAFGRSPILGQNPLFDDTKVASIHVQLPPDSLQYLLSNLVNDRYIRATRFIFDDGVSVRDTLENVGLRLRGNTSLTAQKKSFKLSFNAFAAGGKYRGVKKLNLIGSANDPTMIRQKLFYDIWNKVGLPRRRVSFVKFYLNGEYRGLYSNVEEIDKEWLELVFPEKEGNLYKCTWPADLAYLGSSQQAYKNVMHDATTRAYDLTTNELADDYSDFVSLIAKLHQPLLPTYEANLRSALNVDGYLKAFAVEVAAGHWDDYSYNKNNYYLYRNLASGQFEFVSYDADNTFGIDWVNRDWARRNVYTWQKTSEPRPLTTQLLAVPALKARYTRCLDTLARFVMHPDSIFPRIDFLHNLIAPAAIADPYRALDFGYDVADFHNGFSQNNLDGHTPYGVKPFIGLRRDSILAQIAMMLSTDVSSEISGAEAGFRVFPNPFRDCFSVEFLPPLSGAPATVELFSAQGCLLKSSAFEPGASAAEVHVEGMPTGVFWVRVRSGERVGATKIIRE